MLEERWWGCSRGDGEAESRRWRRGGGKREVSYAHRVARAESRSLISRVEARIHKNCSSWIL